MEHRRPFLERHLGEQVGDALVDRAAGILERIEPAVAIVIAVRDAVLVQERHLARARIRHRWAASASTDGHRRRLVGTSAISTAPAGRPGKRIARATAHDVPAELPGGAVRASARSRVHHLREASPRLSWPTRGDDVLPDAAASAHPDVAAEEFGSGSSITPSGP
jgi:hypothetical protein